MSNWDEAREAKLKELWEKGHTASQIAKILGDTTRNAVIGKAHRLKLAGRTQSRKPEKEKKQSVSVQSKEERYISRRSRFKSLLLDKNFEPAKNLTLEELTDETCKYMEGHPDEENSSFCGRKTIEKFSYCPLHLMIIFQDPRKKKDENFDKEDEVPQFIGKKIKSA